MNLPSVIVDLVKRLVCILVNNEEALARLDSIRNSLPPVVVYRVRCQHRVLKLLAVDHIIGVEFDDAG